LASTRISITGARRTRRIFGGESSAAGGRDQARSATSITSTIQPFNTKVNDLAASGIKFNFVLDRRYHGATSAGAALDSLQASVPNAAESIEGPNEWDNLQSTYIPSGSSWSAEYRKATQEIWNGVQARPALAGKPVLAGAMAFSSKFPSVGDVGAWVTNANMHPYPGGQTPDATASGSNTESRGEHRLMQRRPPEASSRSPPRPDTTMRCRPLPATSPPRSAPRASTRPSCTWSTSAGA
jgi:hypothetical protein